MKLGRWIKADLTRKPADLEYLDGFSAGPYKWMLNVSLGPIHVLIGKRQV